MGKIIISVEDEEKLELLKKFLESVEYIKSVEDFDWKKHAIIIDNAYDRYMILMNMCCEFENGKLIGNTEMINKYPNLFKNKSYHLNCINIGNARKVISFLFEGEEYLPKNTKDFIKKLSEDALTLLKYIEKNYLTFDTLAQALKKHDYADVCGVQVKEIIEMINKEIEDGFDISKVNKRNAIIKEKELVEYFESR